jgi:hypothetical protein
MIRSLWLVSALTEMGEAGSGEWPGGIAPPGHSPGVRIRWAARHTKRKVQVCGVRCALCASARRRADAQPCLRVVPESSVGSACVILGLASGTWPTFSSWRRAAGFI